MMKKVIIIGGGASGLVAANILNSTNKYEITIIDQSNKLARKILASGNGRCNVSNTNIDTKFYNTNNPLVDKIIHSFDPYEFFYDLGMELKQEGNLLYPYSHSSLTVKNTLLHKLDNVSIFDECLVTNIIPGNTNTVVTNKGKYQADYVIVCTGSKANNLSGEHNLDILQNMHLDINPVRPSLVPIKTKEVYKSISGVRSKANVSLFLDEKLIKKESGEVLFTDYGLSGICIMQLSRYIEEGNNYTIQIDLLKDIKDFNEYQRQRTKRLGSMYYEGIFNDKLAKLINDNNINPKKMVFTVKSVHDALRAQVMKGGLSLDEVNDKLELKKYSDIYVCGEVLDVDGACGGYNLHFAFGSGQYVAKKIIEGESDVKD